MTGDAILARRQEPGEDPRSTQEFEALLTYLKRSRGFDFTAYKRSSLMRRVLVRMQTKGITGFANYQDYLQVDPDEFTLLFNTILINVTAFFRDSQVWDHLALQVLPEIVGPEGADHRLRVWSAGCASGEEAYSIAMLLAEALGSDQFRERVKIYATDVDEDALNHARQAMYSEQAVRDVPPHLLQKYFDGGDGRFVFNKELRRSVIFGRHDLIQDAPISKVNLLICRNCMMYFNSDAQSRILAKFHFSLTEGGVLFLGKAETLLTRAATFTQVDIKRRLFAKGSRTQGQERASLVEPIRGGAVMDSNWRLREAANDASPVAQMVLDQQGSILSFNQQLRNLFGLGARDVGRPLQDLEVSYRPFELRSCIDRAYSERRPVSLSGGSWITPNGFALNLDLLVVPIHENGGPLGAVIYFQDVTRQRQLQYDVQRANQELETAYEELQSTNEELETTNEELQSTVEELETTNEELQSTNEELETMNEELQSTNEELQTLNDEGRERNDQISELNAFLEAIVTSLRGAVVVVDRDFRVYKWDYRAQDLWGLRAEEVLAKNFLNLDSGLPVEKLKAPIRACLTGEIDQDYIELAMDANNRRGKPIRLRVTCTPLRPTNDEPPRAVILLMEEMNSKGKMEQER